MSGLKILATGAGAPGARGIFKAFRMGASEEERGLRIIGCDMDPLSYGFHLADKHYVIPPAKSPEFIQKILDICEKEKPDLLFSWVGPELITLAENRKQFEALGTVLVLSSAEALKVAENKASCYSAVSGLGIAPRFAIARDLEGFRGAVSDLGYPEKAVCFKPTVSYGMRGFRVIKNIDPARLLLEEKPIGVFMGFDEAAGVLETARDFPEMIVMEYLEGREYSVDLLLKDGSPVVTIPRERVKTRQGISTTARIEKNEELIETAEAVAKRIGLNYNINMQFMLTQDGPKLIEINPRLSGTVVACVGAGANLPWLAAKAALGEAVERPDVMWGTIVKRFWEEVYTDGKEVWFLGI